MKFNIKQYEKELTFDKPIEYIPIKYKDKLKQILDKLKNVKDKSQAKMLINQMDEILNIKILIYPVKMINYFNFYDNIKCLLIDKNKISDKKIISMSYLDFLITLMKDPSEGQIYRNMLYSLFSLCFHIEQKDLGYKEYKLDHHYFYINNIEFTKKDFDILKKIICYQNMPSYDDRYISPDVQEQIDAMHELKGKDINASLERQIVSLMASTHYTLDEIENMTIRKFILTLEKVDKKLHYQIYTLASFIPFVKFKEKIPHWIYGENEDKFKNILLDAKGFESKIGSALKG